MIERKALSRKIRFRIARFRKALFRMRFMMTVSFPAVILFSAVLCVSLFFALLQALA